MELKNKIIQITGPAPPYASKMDPAVSGRETTAAADNVGEKKKRRAAKPPISSTPYV